MDLGLNGKRALVLGASKGLGKAVAEELVKEGAKVAICSRNEQALAATAQKIGATAFPCDLSDPAQRSGLVNRAAAALGPIDILVVNTGGPPTARFADIDSNLWVESFNGLFMSAVDCVREALPSMMANKWGRVIFVTSIAAKEPIDLLTISNALRAGIHGLVKTLSREVGSHGITVNAVMPGYTLTERLAETKVDLEAISKKIPAGRVGQPDEFAAVATFLASTRAAYVTGQAIAVDGGALWSI